MTDFKHNTYWGKRAGTCSQRIAPKTNWPMGCFIKHKKWGNGHNNSGPSHPPHYTKLLAANAARLGFLNGHRIGPAHAK